MNPYQGGQGQSPYGAPPQAAQPAPHASAGMGQMVLKTDYFFMQWVLLFVTPKIKINGHEYRKPWGTHTYDLPAGTYDVIVSYPYLFFGDCSVARAQVQVYAGYRTFVNYNGAFIIFMSGSIFVAGQQPMQPAMPAAGGWGQPQLPPQGGGGGYPQR